MTIAIRPAIEADAGPAREVLRRSIREPCVADHANDDRILAAWLGDKTPENVRAWIASSSSFSVVAVREGTVSGFGLVGTDGKIRLCYVLPEIRLGGAGKGKVFPSLHGFPLSKRLSPPSPAAP